jgi:hypothetical protein
MLLEEVLLLQWIINHKCIKMIMLVLCQDSQIHHQNKRKIQNNLLNMETLNQPITSWEFKDQQLFLNSKVFWLRDSEKHLKIEEAEESLVSPDNSKSLMIMVLVILISMNSQKLFKISKFKLKRLISKVCLNLWI